MARPGKSERSSAMPPTLTSRSADRVLHALKASGPQSADALARRLKVTAVAVRQHLAQLLAAGTVAFEDRRTGVGRPKRVWTLTDAGHARFPDSHAVLTLELLDAARKTLGAAGFDRMLRRREASSAAAYARELERCKRLDRRVARLAELRSQEGYMAEWRRDGDGTLWLIENHCPICIAARTCQGLCRSELAIFRSVLGEDAVVERVEHLIAGARRCAYRIRFVAPEAGSRAGPGR
ncbi:MAG: helix-turn-helix transcriptional regulator [Dongiaceae bacterium]